MTKHWPLHASHKIEHFSVGPDEDLRSLLKEVRRFLRDIEDYNIVDFTTNHDAELGWSATLIYL